jgi:hypothetical protein
MFAPQTAAAQAKAATPTSIGAERRRSARESSQLSLRSVQQSPIDSTHDRRPGNGRHPEQGSGAQVKTRSGAHDHRSAGHPAMATRGTSRRVSEDFTKIPLGSAGRENERQAGTLPNQPAPRAAFSSRLVAPSVGDPLEHDTHHLAEVPPSVPEVLTRDGKPLDPPLRAFMERRLGTDLGAVRIHSDDGAGESARAIRAKAYAVGHHVVFGPGRFSPATPEGKRLLAHELTHVVQQGAAKFPTPARCLNPSSFGRADSAAEWEAHRNSSSALTVSVAQSVPAGRVMREPEGSSGAKEESGGIFDTLIGGLMGDFREDPTLAEIGVNTAVSLIPVVGEVTAARDVTANVYFMVEKEEYNSFGRWFALVLALISLFPEIGAALKGLGKAILKGVGEALGPIVRLMERVLEKLGHSEGIRNFFLKHWDAIIAKGSALFEKAMGRLSSLLTDTVRFISSKADAFAQGLKRVREAAAQALPSAVDRVKNLIESVLERFGAKEEKQAAKTVEKEAEKTGTQLEKEGAGETEKAGTEAQKGVEEIETGTPPLSSITTPNRYVPDSLGRAKLAEGWLKKAPGGRMPSAQKRLGRGYNVGSPRKFHATHLIADTLGGAGDARNLVMLDAAINVGAIESLEKKLAQRIAKGEQIFVRVQAQYVGGGSRSVMAERLIYEVFRKDGNSLVKDAQHVFEALTKIH